jgi:hypothetical protein
MIFCGIKFSKRQASECIGDQSNMAIKEAAIKKETPE